MAQKTLKDVQNILKQRKVEDFIEEDGSNNKADVVDKSKEGK